MDLNNRGWVTHKYEAILYWSNDDQVFIAEVPELPGCAAHGLTPAEAFANGQEAIGAVAGYGASGTENPPSANSVQADLRPVTRDLRQLIESLLPCDPERLRKVSSLLPRQMGAVDILIYTPEEFATMQREGNAFAEMIAEEGSLVYDRETESRGQARKSVQRYLEGD